MEMWGPDYSSTDDVSCPNWEVPPQHWQRRMIDTSRELKRRTSAIPLRRQVKSLASIATLVTWLGLTASHAALGVTGSLRIPGTLANITLGVSLGHIDLTHRALPTYIPSYQKYNGLNLSPNLRVRTASVEPIFVIGQQHAPFLDLHVSFEH